MIEGEAVQILIPKDPDSFELNTAALENILLQDDVKNKYVVLISVAGAFRKGKSFLLSFLLRYLSCKGSENWMGTMDQPLKGFRWKASQDRVTTGIFMWSKPFFEKLPSGQEVAVLLMDTQGTFDSSSTEKENCTIFALSAMLSSILIYNISENLYESDLLHLQRFAEYGKLALEDKIIPFQKLIFLIRDYPLASHWGAAGGRDLLAKRMQAEKEEHQIVRNLIKSSFSEHSCFLMPPPGKAVTSKEDFDGKFQDIDEDFRNHLKTFVSDLLSSNNLIVKSISGNKITAKSLFDYFHLYMNLFSTDAVPSPRNILLGVIECDNIVALTNAKELYLGKMKEFSDSIVTNDEFEEEQHELRLEELHKKIKMDALELFDGKKKTGGDKYSRKHRESLIKYIEDHYIHLMNLLKNKKALHTLVQQIESMLQKDMNELYGIDSPCANFEDLESTYSRLVAKAAKQFHVTADALVYADSLIQFYKDKLNKGIQNIYDCYAQLNDEKSIMEQMVKEILQEYKSKMQQQFPLDSDALSEPEFRQVHVQIRSEALKSFDSNGCRNQLTDIYKDKLEKEMQIILTNYEENNNQKLYCEHCIERILFNHMAYRNSNISFMQKTKQKLWSIVGIADGDKLEEDESTLQEAQQEFKELVGQNFFFDMYAEKLKDKINKWWTYEHFVSSAKSLYEAEMMSLINVGSGKVSMDQVDSHHRDSKAKAVDSLTNEIQVLGEDKEYISYAKQLQNELDYLYLYYKGLNEGKRNCVIL